MHPSYRLALFGCVIAAPAFADLQGASYTIATTRYTDPSATPFTPNGGSGPVTGIFTFTDITPTTATLIWKLDFQVDYVPVFVLVSDISTLTGQTITGIRGVPVANYKFSPSAQLLSGDSFRLDANILPDQSSCSGSGCLLPGTYTYTLTYDVTLSDVPEPASAAILGVGIAGLTAFRRRRR